MRAFLSAAALAAVSALPAGGASARAPVPFETDQWAGTIVIRHKERALYLVQRGGMALRYPVALGKPGKSWLGSAVIRGKYVSPAWSPPAEVLRDKPYLPKVIPGGSPSNPMGPRAILLSRSEIAIHGTNRPKSIGAYASYGCIRMRNADVIDLFDRVSVGGKVVVVP